MSDLPTIVRFDSKHTRDAIAHAQRGGIALHVWKGSWPDPKPACFVDGEQWGHLIDLDRARLQATAHALGVRRLVISSAGRPTQHVDLCKGPLQRAIEHSVTLDDIEKRAQTAATSPVPHAKPRKRRKTRKHNKEA